MHKLIPLITFFFFISCNLTGNENNISIEDKVCTNLYNYTGTLDLYHGASVAELFNSKGEQVYIDIVQSLTVISDSSSIPNVYSIFNSDTTNLRTEPAPVWLGNMGTDSNKISTYTGISGKNFILKYSTFQPMGNKVTCAKINL